MELKRCRNGHMYDPSITPECPECAKLYGGTAFFHTNNQGMMNQQAEDYGKTVPIQASADSINFTAKGHWSDANKYSDAPFSSEDYEPTRPVDKFAAGLGNSGNIRPVTGWLVCIEGASKGQDFKIHAEYNYIGRASSMDISIPGDTTVSRENHAIIAYDSMDRRFYFAPSSGGSIVRVNGRAVLGSVELNAYDQIMIGQSKFIFIPFCGEKFEWE